MEWKQCQESSEGRRDGCAQWRKMWSRDSEETGANIMASAERTFTNVLSTR